jgi:hypothetical protein
MLPPKSPAARKPLTQASEGGTPSKTGSAGNGALGIPAFGGCDSKQNRIEFHVSYVKALHAFLLNP